MKSRKKYLENIEQAFSYTQTMPFFAQNSLIYPKLQHNNNCFKKLWIVICISLSKYKIMPKIAKQYWVHPELYRKIASFGPNLPRLPKISKQKRPFYQTLDCRLQKLLKIWNYAKNNYKILCWPWVKHQKCHFWPRFASFTQFLETGIIFSKNFQITHFLSWICISIPKISLIHHFVLEI